MKKNVLTIAILMSAGLFTFSQHSFSSSQSENIPTEYVYDHFRIVDFDELNEDVRATLNGYREKFTFILLEYSESQKQTQVTMQDKETKSLRIILVDDSGMVIE